MFSLGETIWDFDLKKILDAFLQLLLNRELFFNCFFFAAHVGLPGARSQSSKQITFPPHLRLLDQLDRALLDGAIKSLDVGLAGHGTTDDRLLGRAGLRLAVAARSGEVIARRTTLPLFVTLAILATAVTV